MADKLDALLESGERVVYRDPRPHWRLCGLFIVTAMAGAMFTLITVYEWASSNAHVLSLVYLVLMATVTLGLSFQTATFIGRNALLVTNWRVVHRCGWWKETVTAIPLDEIRELTRRPGNGLEIHGKYGEKISHFYCKWPEKLAQTVARATGVALPGFPGRKERLVQVLITSVEILALVISLILFLEIDSVRPESLGVLGSVLWLVGLFTVLITIYFTTSLLGFLIVIAAARTIMSADEMRDGLCRDAEINRLNRMCTALLLRFASVLYGQPLRCKGCTTKAEAHHGG